jgi:hypothetical protein
MSNIAQKFMFKQQHNMKKSKEKNTPRKSMISRPVLEFSFFKFFSNGVSSSSFLLGIYSPVSCEMSGMKECNNLLIPMRNRFQTVSSHF